MENSFFECDILLQIKTLSKTLHQDFNNRLEEHGLTGPQGRVLFYISKNVNEGFEMHQKDIEKHFALTKSTVSGLIERMVKNGIITKTMSSQYSILKPTEKGQSIVNDVHRGRQETINKMFKGFNQKEINQMKENIKKLIVNMKEDSVNVAKN